MITVVDRALDILKFAYGLLAGHICGSPTERVSIEDHLLCFLPLTVGMLALEKISAVYPCLSRVWLDGLNYLGYHVDDAHDNTKNGEKRSPIRESLVEGVWGRCISQMKDITQLTARTSPDLAKMNTHDGIDEFDKTQAWMASVASCPDLTEETRMKKMDLEEISYYENDT